MMSYRNLYIALSLIALAGCADSGANDFVAPIIAETAISAKSSNYKMSEVTYDVPWLPGDDISIFREAEDGESIAQKYSSLLEMDQSSVESNFRGNEFENESGKYYAVYPHFLTNSANYSEGSVSFDLAKSQNFDSAKALFATGLNFAVAESSTLGDFQFENVCGFLQVNLIGSGTIHKINVTTTDGVPLWGRATVDMASGDITIENSDADAAVVSLNCGDEGIELTDAEQLFTIVLPPIKSTNEYVVTLNDETTPLQTTKQLAGAATLAKGDVTYVLDGEEVTIYSPSDFEGDLSPELQASSTWIIFSENKTPSTEELSCVIDKAAAQSSDMVVSFLTVTEIPEGGLVATNSMASNNLSLAFPKATKIGARAFEKWGSQIYSLSLVAPEALELADDAFSGVEVENCALLLDGDYNPYMHDMTICTTWQDMEWGAINGNRKYSLSEFDSNGLLADGTSPKGSVWWVAMPDDSSTSFDGLKAALSLTGGGVSLHFVGDISATDENYTNTFAGNTKIAEVDMSDFTTIPEGFLMSSVVTKAKLNKDIESIGTKAFNNCDSFIELSFSEGERVDQTNGYSVGNACFLDCASIAELDLEWATSINDNSFTQMGKLAVLKLPRATKFGVSIIGSSNALNEVYFTADGDFTNLAATADIVTPEGAYINILGSVFARCTANIHLYLHSSKKDVSETNYTVRRHTQQAYKFNNEWVWHVNSNAGNIPLIWKKISFIDDEGNIDGAY